MQSTIAAVNFLARLSRLAAREYVMDEVTATGLQCREYPIYSIFLTLE
jgi:hypothetical protein